MQHYKPKMTARFKDENGAIPIIEALLVAPAVLFTLVLVFIWVQAMSYQPVLNDMASELATTFAHSGLATCLADYTGSGIPQPSTVLISFKNGSVSVDGSMSDIASCFQPAVSDVPGSNDPGTTTVQFLSAIVSALAFQSYKGSSSPSLPASVPQVSMVGNCFPSLLPFGSFNQHPNGANASIKIDIEPSNMAAVNQSLNTPEVFQPSQSFHGDIPSSLVVHVEVACTVSWASLATGHPGIGSSLPSLFFWPLVGRATEVVGPNE